MRIQRAIFEDFLKKITIGGTASSVLLDFKDKGVYCNSVDDRQIIMVESVISAHAFEKYEAIGKVGIRDINNLIKMVKRFKEKVTIRISKNFIVFKEKTKKVEMSMCDESFIGEPIEMDLDYEYKFKIDKNTLSEYVNDASALKEPELFIKVKDNKILFTIDGTVDKLKNTHTTEQTTEEKIDVKLDPKYFGIIVNSLSSSEVTVFLKSDYPLKIKELSGDVTTTFILSPKVTDEEDKEETEEE